MQASYYNNQPLVTIILLCKPYSLDEALVDASEGEFTVEVDCSLSELPSSILLFSSSLKDSEEVSAADGDPWW
jgi:hypothetical protein